MKISMNGFRRNLTSDLQELREVAASIINDEQYDKEDLVKTLNAVIQHSNILNCIYVTDDPDFSDMGDLETDPLEEGGAA